MAREIAVTCEAHIHFGGYCWTLHSRPFMSRCRLYILWKKPSLTATTGSNFGPVGSNTVLISGIPCNVIGSLSAHETIACTTQLCFGNLTVTVAREQSTTVPYTYTALVQLAEITGFTPSSGPTAGGTALQVTGTGFGLSGSVRIQQLNMGTKLPVGDPLPCPVTLYQRTQIQ
jgi:hypothetical protein